MQRAYYFYPRTDIKEKAVTWKKNFRGGNVDSCFRVEIGTTVKSDKIVVIDNGLLVTN